MTDEQKLNIRMTLAIQRPTLTLDEAKAWFDWIVGPESKIVKPTISLVSK